MITTLKELQDTFWQEHGFLRSYRQAGKRHCEYHAKIQDHFNHWLDLQCQHSLIAEDIIDDATLTEED